MNHAPPPETTNAQSTLSAILCPTAWALAVFFNVTVIAYVSPFVGPNILVPLAGGYDAISYDFLNLSLVAGPIIFGAMVGFLIWRLIRPALTPGAARSPRTAILAFSLSAFLAFMGVFALLAIPWAFHPALCIVGPLLWGTSVAIPIIVGLRSIASLQGTNALTSRNVPHA